MSTEFEREERYLIFKLSDVEEHFTPGEKQQLARLVEVQRVGREEAGKAPLECVVVESDWPEYEPTWNAIEARMTGAQPAPIEQDTSVRKAWARFSNELHRGPDAPYPGMSEAFEQHFSQSFTDRDWRAESGTWAAAWKAAKRHGAQPAPSLASDDVSLISEGKTQPAQSVKDAIIDDLQSQFDSEGITEHDSGDALIRLSDAIAAVEDNFVQTAPSVPDGWLHHAARMAALARKLREPDWHFESIREMQRELCALEEAALAAAPEAKP